VLGQWAVLTQRFARILYSDKANRALLAAQPLVIAVLICLVCRDLPQIFFLLVISALWFGCSSAAQQIVKERGIYRRERMVNLRLEAYVLSKSLTLAAACAGRCALMLGVAWLSRGREGDLVVQGTGLILAAWNGVAMGLVISALASNADKAMSVVPLSLLPQIIVEPVSGLYAARGRRPATVSARQPGQADRSAEAVGCGLHGFGSVRGRAAAGGGRDPAAAGCVVNRWKGSLGRPG
jgi:hypothetical protein